MRPTRCRSSQATIGIDTVATIAAATSGPTIVAVKPSSTSKPTTRSTNPTRNQDARPRLRSQRGGSSDVSNWSPLTSRSPSESQARHGPPVAPRSAKIGEFRVDGRGRHDQAPTEVEPEEEGRHDAEKAIELCCVLDLRAEEVDGEQVHRLKADCNDRRTRHQLDPTRGCVRQRVRRE